MQPKIMNLAIKVGDSTKDPSTFITIANEEIDIGNYADDINLNKPHDFQYAFQNIASSKVFEELKLVGLLETCIFDPNNEELQKKAN
jgi:hypothetical protein